MCREPSGKFSTVAPSARITRMAAWSSLEEPGFLMMLSPAEIRAAAQALCSELLEAGADREPWMEEGEMITFILFYLALEME